MRRLSAVLALFAATLLQAGTALAQPTFSKSFLPATIGPGSVSTLLFTIENAESGVPAEDLAFIDNLPMGTTIADPSMAQTTCSGGLLSAPPGGNTINFSGGSVAANGVCTVRVDVTSDTPGVHMNVSGDLTSTGGNSGPAAADLTVATDRPGFSKSFAPGSVSLGSRSTLTFTIDNSANPSQMFNLLFTDVLPTGLVVADPALVSDTCVAAPFTGGVVTAIPGTNLVSVSSAGVLAAGSVAAGGTCTISLDVVATGIGSLDNSSGSLTSSPITGGPTRESGKANASLDVTADQVHLIKAFTDDPAAPGATATLEFTIFNRSRTEAATDLSFTDDLDATLSGLVATGLPQNNVCGAGSQISGTSVVTLTGGNLAGGTSCTFAVTVQVPATAVPGIYPNLTGSLTGDLAGSPFTSAPAEDVLVVSPAPLLTKTFLDSPVQPGGSTRMEFSITNTSATDSATSISFLDELTSFLPFPISAVLPANGFCGGGSTISLISLGIEQQGLFMTGGNLAAGASCTFEVTLNLPVGLPSGTYVNTTGAITATVGGTAVTGGNATASFDVVGPPALAKSFVDDPVAAGDTVTLEFSLTHDGNAPGDATGISFTDDLNATLTGLVAVGLPANDVCGAGSQISGTGLLTFSGGTLAPGETCTFQVTLQTPVGAAPGNYTNTTSNVSADVLGLMLSGPGATDDMVIASLLFTKEFIDDPVIPGGTVTLRFTIDNQSTTDATGISFTDNLDVVLSGLTATGLPATPCGAGSTITGTTNLVFNGGNLTAGTSCTFDVTLQVPAAAATGTYANLTSTLTSSVGTAPPATDLLEVNDVLLQLTKSFTNDPVSPGGTVTLEFTLSNLDPVNAASAIGFTDDLGAALSGLTAVGLPADGFCGAGSQLSGAGLLTLTGGNLPAGGSCTFSVTLAVPAGAGAGNYLNTTSGVTGTITGLGVTGTAASDTLQVVGAQFTKAFAGPAAAGGTVVLNFSITNLDGATGLNLLGFTDDLNAVLPGLVAVGLPQANVCGAGSQISGTGLLTLTGGNLGPGGSCSFPVTLQLPPTATAGSYPNSTSQLVAGGISIAPPATALLQVEPPPVLGKTFAPTAIGIGQVSLLTLTIDNTASALPASNLAVTDNLPAGMIVANPANASTTCSGGTLTATPGTGLVSYSGGSVAAGTSCIITVDVTATVSGNLVNTTGDLTSSSGNGGTASASLLVNPQPGFSKAFTPGSILPGATSTLSFLIDNGGSTVAATGLGFTDILPAGMTLATPANGSTSCTGGTLTALDGSGSLSYSGGSVAAGATCTVQVDVVASSVGILTNTSSPLSSSLGSSGPAVASLNVVALDLSFSKIFLDDRVLPGSTLLIRFTLQNNSPDFAVDGISFSDDLDAFVPGATANGLPAADVCGPGSLVAGSSLVSLTGGSLPPLAICQFDLSVTVPAATPPGTYTNTTSPVSGLVNGVAQDGVSASAALQIGQAVAVPTLSLAGLLLLMLGLMGMMLRAGPGRRR